MRFVEEEVRSVEYRHRRVLGELNLAVEAMLMPSNSQEGSEGTETEVDDQLADLLTVGPTDELLSPVPLVDMDSGFSGSSSGASYRSAIGSLRRGERPKSSAAALPRTSTPSEPPTPNKGFWKKGWTKKLGFSSTSLNKQKDKGESNSFSCFIIVQIVIYFLVVIYSQISLRMFTQLDKQCRFPACKIFLSLN